MQLIAAQIHKPGMRGCFERALIGHGAVESLNTDESRSENLDLLFKLYGEELPKCQPKP